MPTRQEMWQSLGDEVDMLVIGGGINGAGIARDAAQRGYKVALVEMRDLAFGTSSRSSKLVHGGLRYLEMLDFGLVFEAVSERRVLLDLAPHLVNPLGFLFPVYKHSRRSLTTINAGMWLYEGLSLFRSPKRHRKLKPSDVEREEPTLNRESLKGAPLYYDCSTDDARLTLENGVAAAEEGATVLTYTKAVGFERTEGGRIEAVRLRDEFSGQERVVRTRVVINATGPWTDRTLDLNPDNEIDELLRPTKGVHIVVAREVLPVNNAVVCFHPEDERVLFALPWGDSTYVGTTDTDYEGDPADVYTTADDVDYLIEAAAAYFPENPIRYEDIHCTWAGLRPLMRPATSKKSVDESAVSREHQVIVGHDGLITIAGGKLTTYRRMCEEVVDTAYKMLKLQGTLPEGVEKRGRTDESPLPGAEGWPEDDDASALIASLVELSDGHLGEDTAELLANTYGGRATRVAQLVKDRPELNRRLLPHRPEILAQVDFGVSDEFAATVTDILKQRTQIFYRDREQGLAAIPVVATRLQELIGWSDEERATHEEGYRAEVALSRRWLQEGASRAAQ